MKKMNVAEMQNANGGVAFSSLCAAFLYFYGASSFAGVLQKKYFKKKKKK